MQGIIEDIAFGGEGVLKNEGKVIFIPFTAPQDEGIFEITTEKKTHAFGKLKSLIHPSPQRTSPLCPVFERCGGCQFQHISYPHQLKIKEKFISDALTRIGKISFPILPIFSAPKQFAYRQYITLHLRTIQNELVAGFVGHNPSEFIPIPTCPIFCEQNDPVFSSLKKLLKALSCVSFKKAQVKLLKTSSLYIAVFSFFPTLPKNAQQILESHASEWAALHLSSPSEKHFWGLEYLALSFLGLTLYSSPHSFLQNFTEQSEALHSFILSSVSSQSKKILDLYCGIGITSLLLAREGKEVCGVELNLKAIELALLNATKNNLKAEFKQGKVEILLPQLLTTFQPDCVILNPPRTGLDPQVIAALNSSPPKELLYISCMPATLARDLPKLTQFKIHAIQPFDMFPQTTHVETVVALKQK